MNIPSKIFKPKGFTILSIFFFTVCACSQTPISEYVPKSQTEREIIEVLAKYQESKNRFDVEGYLECLHDRGHFVFDSNARKAIDKMELKKILPDFWSKLKIDDQSVIPTSWESINGNHLQYGWLADPRMRIYKDRAEVKTVFTNGWWFFDHRISLVKQDGKWLITNLAWEPF